MYRHNLLWSRKTDKINLPVAPGNNMLARRNAYAPNRGILPNMPPANSNNANTGAGSNPKVAGAGAGTPKNKMKVLRDRESKVFMCVWNPCIDFLATGSNNSTARIWDISEVPVLVPNPTVLNHFIDADLSSNTEKDITALDWSNDGNFLATGSFEGYNHIWTVDGTLISTLGKHDGPIFGIKWNKRGNLLLSASADKKAIIWDRWSGLCLQQFGFHTGPVIDVDWKTNTCFASCSTDKHIYVCELNYAVPKRTFIGHQDEVNAVKWNPQGELLASCSDDATLKIWNMTQNTPISDLRVHNKEIYSIKWSPTGPGTQYPNMNSILASGSFDSTIRMWDVERGLALHALTKHSAPIYCIDFSPDGQYLASGSLDNEIYIWSTNTGEVIDTFKAPDSIYEVCWNSTGTKVAATSGNGGIAIIDVRMT